MGWLGGGSSSSSSRLRLCRFILLSLSLFWLCLHGLLLYGLPLLHRGARHQSLEVLILQTPDEEEPEDRLVRTEFVSYLSHQFFWECALVKAYVPLQALSCEVQILILRCLTLLEDSCRSSFYITYILEHLFISDCKIVHEFLYVAICGFL
jgi:hypothetical protein